MVVVLLVSFFIIPYEAIADVWVNGYYRSSGTYVQGHYRSSPDGNPYNNWSYPGNTNPYTGVTAGGNPSTYLENYYDNSYSSSYSSSIYDSSYDYGSNYSSPDYNSYCYDNYGYNSSYDSLSNACECSYGYVLNSDQTSCIDGNAYCQIEYGYKTSYNRLDNACECDSGYSFNGKQCTKDVSYNPTIFYSASSVSSISNSDSISSESNVYNLAEGALIRAKNSIDIYIVKYMGSKRFKRLILSPSVFDNYGHLRWENVIEVDQSTLDSFETSDLVIGGDYGEIYKLYPKGDTGEKRQFKNYNVLVRLGYDADSVYIINHFDRDSYITGAIIE